MEVCKQHINKIQFILVKYFYALAPAEIEIFVLKNLIRNEYDKLQYELGSSVIHNVFYKLKLFFSGHNDDYIFTGDFEIFLENQLDKLTQMEILEKKMKGISPYYSLNPEKEHEVRSLFKTDSKNCNHIIAALKERMKMDSGLSIDYIKKFLPLAENLLEKIDEVDENIRLLSFLVSSRYREIGNFEESIKYSLREIEIGEKLYSRDDSTLANSYYNVSLTYKKANILDKALEYQLKTLILREQVLDKNHPWLANNSNVISRTYREIGDHQKAIEFSLKELGIREKIQTTHRIDIAHIYKNLAISFYNLAHIKKAKDFIDKSVELFTKSYPENNIHAKSAINLQKVITDAFIKCN